MRIARRYYILFSLFSIAVILNAPIIPTTQYVEEYNETKWNPVEITYEVPVTKTETLLKTDISEIPAINISSYQILNFSAPANHTIEINYNIESAHEISILRESQFPKWLQNNSLVKPISSFSYNRGLEDGTLTFTSGKLYVYNETLKKFIDVDFNETKYNLIIKNPVPPSTINMTNRDFSSHMEAVYHYVDGSSTKLFMNGTRIDYDSDGNKLKVRYPEYSDKLKINEITIIDKFTVNETRTRTDYIPENITKYKKISYEELFNINQTQINNNYKQIKVKKSIIETVQNTIEIREKNLKEKPYNTIEAIIILFYKIIRAIYNKIIYFVEKYNLTTLGGIY